MNARNRWRLGTTDADDDAVVGTVVSALVADRKARTPWAVVALRLAEQGVVDKTGEPLTANAVRLRFKRLLGRQEKKRRISQKRETADPVPAELQPHILRPAPVPVPDPQPPPAVPQRRDPLERLAAHWDAQKTKIPKPIR